MMSGGISGKPYLPKRGVLPIPDSKQAVGDAIGKGPPLPDCECGGPWALHAEGGGSCLECECEEYESPMPDNEPATDKGPIKLMQTQENEWFWVALTVEAPMYGPHSTEDSAISSAKQLGYTYTPPATPPLNPPEQSDDNQPTSSIQSGQKTNESAGVEVTSTTPELLPCVHCGVDPGWIETQRTIVKCWAECSICGAHGPHVPIPADPETGLYVTDWALVAISAWNKRAG